MKHIITGACILWLGFAGCSLLMGVSYGLWRLVIEIPEILKIMAAYVGIVAPTIFALWWVLERKKDG